VFSRTGEQGLSNISGFHRPDAGTLFADVRTHSCHPQEEHPVALAHGRERIVSTITLTGTTIQTETVAQELDRRRLGGLSRSPG
jgi:hypothetical protein